MLVRKFIVTKYNVFVFIIDLLLFIYRFDISEKVNITSFPPPILKV